MSAPHSIEPLRALDNADARRLIHGYESEERYVVARADGAERASFDLRRAPVPYAKRFPVPSDGMLDWYRGLLGDGLSFGAHAADGTLAALAICGHMEWNNTATLWEIHVAPDRRREGIARALLQRVEAAATAKGARRVWIETQTTNMPAIELYRTCGYEIAGLDVWYYSNQDEQTGEIALFMQKPLRA